MTLSLHIEYMREALALAEQAASDGEIPVGALIVQGNTIIGRGRNARETTNDPTAHAEILALREAAATIGDWRLTNCTLYATLEPCPLCAGAAAMARIDLIVFGAWDKRMGCCGSAYDIPGDNVFGKSIPSIGGLLQEECAGLLRGAWGRGTGERRNGERGERRTAEASGGKLF